MREAGLRVLPCATRLATDAVVALAASAAVFLFLTGCQQPQRPGPAPRPAPRVIGHSVEGRPIEVYTLGTGADAVLILAAIHGNEGAGAVLAQRLIDELGARPSLPRGKRVIVIPVANPDGLSRGTRVNARGVDLNRNFPAKNFAATTRHGGTPLSEPESQALHRLLQEARPALVISIHQPLACVDYDGPAAKLAEKIATQASLPVRRLGSLPGSLGSYVGTELGIPIITLELPRGAGRLTPDELWQRYGPALLNAVLLAHPARAR